MGQRPGKCQRPSSDRNPQVERSKVMAGFDPDAYLAAKKAAPASGGFDPDAYLATKKAGAPSLGVPNIEAPPAPAQDGAYAGVTPKDFMNFVSSIGENIPILGPAAVAGGERFGALLRSSLHDDMGYEEALAAIQAANERTRSQRLDESPVAAGIAAPIAGAMAVPAPFVGVKGAAGVASRIAGNAGLSAADDLARGEIEEIPMDAGLVGGVQAAIETAPLVKRTALNRALKAAFGQQKKAFVETAKAGKLDTTADALLAADEAGDAVVKFGSTPEDIAPRAKAKKEFFGEKIKAVGKEIDAIVPAAVSGQEIAAKLRGVLDGIVADKETAAIRKELAERIEEFEAMGDMSFAKAQGHKDNVRYKQGDNSPQLLPQDIRNKVKMAIGETMEESVAKVAAANGMPELAAKYADGKEGYSIFKPVAKFAEDRALGDKANRLLAPSDMYIAGTMGGSAFMGSLLTGGDTGSASGASTSAMLIGAGASNLVRRRGSAAAAVTAKFLGDLLDTQPVLFGRFKGQLKAAKERGSSALVLTHEALLRSPDYQGMVGALTGDLTRQDGDVAVIDNPVLLESYRKSISDNPSLSNLEKANAIDELNRSGFYTMDVRPYTEEFDRLVSETETPAASAPKTVPEIAEAMKKAAS
jgi:hypothetical protein